MSGKKKSRSQDKALQTIALATAIFKLDEFLDGRHQETHRVRGGG